MGDLAGQASVFTMLLGAVPGGLPFYVDKHLPLTRVDPDTGREVDVLCVRIGGKLVFHPDRLDMVKAEIAWRDSAHLARWADDGGRADE